MKKRKYLKDRGEITEKRQYTKPIVIKFAIDNSISLVMMTTTPPNPPPRGGTNKGTQDPFQSPFGDKPFA